MGEASFPEASSAKKDKIEAKKHKIEAVASVAGEVGAAVDAQFPSREPEEGKKGTIEVAAAVDAQFPPREPGEGKKGTIEVVGEASDQGAATTGGALPGSGLVTDLREVWRHNWEGQIETLNNLMDFRVQIIVAIDTEFATRAATTRGRPPTGEDWYNRVRVLAGTADLVQIGIALCFPELSSNQIRVWECKLALTLLTYLRDFSVSFPASIDVRVLALLWQPSFHGKLDDLAGMLGVSRTGASHHAGSDAVLTMRCYFAVRCLLGGDEVVRRHNRVLCGLYQSEVSVFTACPAGDLSITVLHVRAHNFQHVAGQVGGIIQSNFTVISLKVSFVPPLRPGGFSPDAQLCYDGMQRRLGERRTYDIALVFATMEGQVASATCFLFHVCLSGGELIHPEQFARMMLDQGMLSNRSLQWVSFIGAESVALIYDMVSCSFGCIIPLAFSGGARIQAACIHSEPGCIHLAPPLLAFHDYLTSRRPMFPTMHDLGLLVPRGGSMDLRQIARRLGIEHAEEMPEAGISRDAVLTMRCFIQLLMTGRVPSRDARHLLAGCCCRSMYLR